MQEKDPGIEQNDIIINQEAARRLNIQPTALGVLRYFEEIWKRVNPGFAFECHSLMHEYEHMYDRGKNLGLLGLTSYTAERRTKEFGVRKILGSSAIEIFLLLARQFSLWVLLGVCMAWPIGYWLTEQWLGNFAYRIESGISTFLISSG